jgi:hypothetical protein
MTLAEKEKEVAELQKIAVRIVEEMEKLKDKGYMQLYFQMCGVIKSIDTVIKSLEE